MSAQRKLLHIDGMNCQGCATAVDKALRRVEGVQEVDVNLETRSAWVTAEEGVPATRLVAAVQEAGFLARPADIR